MSVWFEKRSLCDNYSKSLKVANNYCIIWQLAAFRTIKEMKTMGGVSITSDYHKWMNDLTQYEVTCYKLF